MPFKITTKLLGYVSGGLAVLCLLLGIATYVQSNRLSDAKLSARTAIEARDQAVTVANQRATDLQARDVLISVQSAGIQALKDQSDKDRAAYQARVAAAAAQAAPRYAEATKIIQLPAPPADQQCEAARKLILEELMR